MRKREYIPEVLTERGETPVAWWQRCSVTQFNEKIAQLPDEDLHQLRSEIKGSISILQAQLESRRKDDPEWWRRARAALGFCAEKSHLLKAELRRRTTSTQKSKSIDADDKRTKRRERLLSLRDEARGGDVEKSLCGLIDYMLEAYE